MRKMKIHCIEGKGFSSNTYILEHNGEAFVFDPSAGTGEISECISRLGVSPIGIILTHGHFDHTLSLSALRKKYSVPVLIHEDDNEMLTDSGKNAGRPLLFRDFICSPAEKTFVGGDRLSLGGGTLNVIHTPGHTKGSCCFLAEDIMITGDTVFARGFGRYDLYGGDGATLFKSLAGLARFDNETKIYPGHGGAASLGNALKSIGIITQEN